MKELQFIRSATSPNTRIQTIWFRDPYGQPRLIDIDRTDNYDVQAQKLIMQFNEYLKKWIPEGRKA